LPIKINHEGVETVFGTKKTAGKLPNGSGFVNELAGSKRQVALRSVDMPWQITPPMVV